MVERASSARLRERSSSSNRERHEPKRVLEHEQALGFVLAASCECLHVKIKDLSDSVNISTARDLATNSRYEKYWNYPKNFNFSDKVAGEFWSTAVIQPQGPSSGFGRVRNIAATLAGSITIDNEVPRISSLLSGPQVIFE